MQKCHHFQDYGRIPREFAERLAFAIAARSVGGAGVGKRLLILVTVMP